MGIKFEASLINNMVNNVYKQVGRNDGAIAASNAASKAFGAYGEDKLITSSEMKDRLNDRWGGVALTLRDEHHPADAAYLTDTVVEKMDSADGRNDGMVRVEASDAEKFWKKLGFPVAQKGVDVGTIKRGLLEGSLVFGAGSQLMGKSEAQAEGVKVVAVHQNEKGPKITLEQ